MIYIACNRNGGGNRVYLDVCEKVCKGECLAYEELIIRRDQYINIFYDPEVCLACGGTGITEDDYFCEKCGAVSPWRFPEKIIIKKRRNSDEF